MDGHFLLCMDGHLGVPLDKYYVDDPFGWLVLLWITF